MKRLMKELASLSTNPLPGITLVDDQNDMSVVQAIIDGPVDTPYEEGRFRITLKLGNDYPTAPPKGSCGLGWRRRSSSFFSPFVLVCCQASSFVRFVYIYILCFC